MTKSIDKAQKGEVLIKGNIGDNVPDESLTAYKTAPYWVDLAGRIFPVSSKP